MRSDGGGYGRCSATRQSPVRQPLGGGWLNFPVTGGLLLFLAAGGLLIRLLPFGRFAQVSVLLHTALGVPAAAIFAVWQFSHWRATRKAPRRPRKVSAYIGFWLLAASFLSGLVLTWDALFGAYTSHLWSRMHLWTSVVAVPFLVWHMVPERARATLLSDAARRSMWKSAATGCAALLLLSAGVAVLSEKSPDLPAPSAGNPFAPGNAATETGAIIPISLLANSASCGAPGCHTAIYQEWRANAHRWSAEDHFFQTVRSVMTELHGREVTEKCSGCHDPVSLLSGHKDPNLGARAPGYSEGDSCVVCHAIRRVDERGIGSYTLGAPRPYLYEGATAPLARGISHFLIRAYPAQHSRDYSLAPVRKADSCAPCHKEYDVIIPEQGPVQVETQYDDWKAGKWNTAPDPRDRLYCQQCHMYYLESPSDALADPYDRKAGLGRKHRNHYFAAGNQFMPEALGSPDAAGQIERVTQWLQGRHVIPEIQKIWPEGPVVALKIEAPPTAEPGDHVRLQSILTNNKAGHGFPTGPLNIVRAWLELTVSDSSGRAIFHSGLLDAENHIEAGSYVLKPLAIDLHGRMIQEPDLWHPDGPVYRPAVLPGQSARYDYEFGIPPGSRGALRVRARLRYRKANQYFVDSVYPSGSRTAPITDISTAEVSIPLRSAGDRSASREANP